MSEEKAVVTQEFQPPAEWRDREEIVALANRLRAMIPGKLTAEEALLLAQYSAAMDANPFRGEVYAYQERGKLILVEGYKLLVRWARRQCHFYDQYRRVTNDTDTLREGDIAFRCYLLRQDAVDDLARLTQSGVPNAYDIVTIQAVGVVSKADRTTKEGKPMNPPKGWTWEEVARKRSLKNAINRAYGTPSPREIAEESWMVGDQVTVAEDWDGMPEMIPAEREALALANARQRERQPIQQTAAQSLADLGFGEPEPEPPITMPQETEAAEKTEETPPGQPESPEEATGNGNGNGSPWHSRFALINRAREEIGYYGDNAFHIIGALKKLEGLGKVAWANEDEVVFGALNLYAKQRADEKAAEQEKKPAGRKK